MSASNGFFATSSIAETRRTVADARRRGLRVGCVPTMGALHAGHLSLVEAARAQTGFVVVTIFVNPAQFGPHEDFQKYPRSIEQDLARCRDAGVSLAFMPDVAAIYPSGYATWVDVEGLSSVLEGEVRPGHFRGVATIVLKLLNIVQPDAAFFGAKDYQQQVLVRRMVRDLEMPVDIAVCPTVREPDGLALSSRNAYLSPAERRSALVLQQSVQLAEQRLRAGERDVAAVQQSMLDLMRSRPSVIPDYAVIADPDTLVPLPRPQPQMVALVAARVGSTRLIDNRPIQMTSDE